ncbi:AQJ64_40280 family protein [Streptomyces flavovirens]|nr:amine oxidase [Streptomyces sp. SID8358]MYX72420.1 amine oxidase [Streptomyces sp. SID3915]
MADLKATVTWTDVREALPREGVPVAAAITGRYPAGSEDGDAAPGEEFWLVATMYFTPRHFDNGEVTRDCFVDSDGVIRFPCTPGSDGGVTHWAELPTLPGTRTHFLGGEEVGPALRNAWRTASDT